MQLSARDNYHFRIDWVEEERENENEFKRENVFRWLIEKLFP